MVVCKTKLIAVCLWERETRKVRPFNQGNSVTSSFVHARQLRAPSHSICISSHGSSSEIYIVRAAIEWLSGDVVPKVTSVRRGTKLASSICFFTIDMAYR